MGVVYAAREGTKPIEFSKDVAQLEAVLNSLSRQSGGHTDHHLRQFGV